MRRTRSNNSMFGLMIIVIAVIALFIGSVIGGVVGFTLANGWSSDNQNNAFEQQTAGSGLDGQPTETGLASIVNRGARLLETNDAPATGAVETVLPAVVTVVAEGTRGTGSGSGFFVSESGYVVTNNHVIESAQSLSVIYAKGGQAPATLVGNAPEFDLAVLKVDGPVPGIIAWGDSSTLPLGAPVIAIGSALGEYRNTVTAGILSGFNRQIGPMGGLLQTDAAINQGNSGGPLIDQTGQVIGVNTLVVRGDFADAEGLGFAIPSNTARSVVRNLIETGFARHPFLGIRYQALNPQLANEVGLTVTEGALLENVLPGTPAAQAGLQNGDVIMAINGRPVNDRNSLVSLLLEHVAGDTITLDILRQGQTFQTQLTLSERA